MATQVAVHNHISIYAVGRYDPTRTLMLRNAFVRDVRGRFNKLCAVINQAIIQEDCFTLMPGSGGYATMAQMTTPGRHAFDFPRSGDKVTAFMNWLKKQEQAGILEVTSGQQLGTAVENAWTNKYILSSYQKGIARGRQELRKAGHRVPSIPESGGMQVAFNTPFHLDRVGLMYTRTFSELQGITAAMDQQIGRVLGQAIAEGKAPREMAQMLVRTITGPSGDLGLTDRLGRFIPAERRAEMLARTETIRAHHTATIQEYKNWGAVGVKVMAEWQTAGGDACEECAFLEGQVFALQDIEGMIPFHPNCRCVAIPVDVTDDLAMRAPIGEEAMVGELEKFAPLTADAIKDERILAESFKKDVVLKGFGDDSYSAGNLKRFAEETLQTRLSRLPEGKQADYKYFVDHFFHARPGVSSERKIISNWAESSGDSDIDAILLQRAAKEEFGLELSTLKHIEDDTIRALEAKLAMMDTKRVMNGARTFLREMYNETQEVLKAKGYKSLPVYRGMGYFERNLPPAWAKALREAESVGITGEVQLQPMSSFSTRLDIAKKFANEADGDCVILAGKVPAERIISISRTGFGCLGESEVVALGGTDKMAVLLHKGYIRPSGSEIKSKLISASEKLASEAKKVVEAGKVKAVAQPTESLWMERRTMELIRADLREYGVQGATHTGGMLEKQAIEQFNTLGHTIAQLTADNPVIAKSLKNNPISGFTLEKGKTISGKLGFYSPYNGSIRMAGSIVQNPLMKPTIGKYSVGGDLQTVFRHELGHHLQQTLSRSKYNRIEWMQLFSDKGVPWFRKNVSHYAGTNCSEAWSEAFAAWSNPNKLQAAKQLPKEISKFFDKMFSK